MYTVRIKLKAHVAEYLQGKFGTGTPVLVRLPNSSDLFFVLLDLLSKRPESCPVDKGNCEILIPDREYGKHPVVYNYISDNAQEVFSAHAECVMWADIHQYMEEQKHVKGINYLQSAYFIVESLKIKSISTDAIIKNHFRWRKRCRRTWTSRKKVSMKMG